MKCLLKGKVFKNTQQVCGRRYWMVPLLTNDKGGDEARGRHGRVALGPERLQQVVGEGERRDGVAGRDDDEQRGPQVQERRQGAEGLVDVRVVAAGLEFKHQLSNSSSRIIFE